MNDSQSLPDATLIIIAPLPVTRNGSDEVGSPDGEQYVIKQAVDHRVTRRSIFYQGRCYSYAEGDYT